MQSILHQSFEIPGSAGARIRGDVRLSHFVLARKKKLPVIILCHGFKGFKNWGFFPYLAEELTRNQDGDNGYVSLAFNFSHNGIGEDLVSCTDLKRFQENTISLEAEDLRLILKSVREGNLPLSECFDTERIYLLGHSRGGVPVLWVAAEDPKIKAISTLASIAEMPIPTLEKQREWREKGITHVLNQRTGQELPLGEDLLNDMLKHERKIEESARAIKIPWLIIHGSLDQSVPVEAAYALSSFAPHAKLCILPDADHTFGAKHPFEGESIHLRKVVQELRNFLT